MNKVKDCRYGKIIYNNQDIYIGRAFEKYGEYSQYEVDFLKQIIQKNNIILDIGANIGGLTVPFANMVGEKGRVFAFEPQRWIYYTLCGNIALNNLHNVYCLNCAVGNKMDFISIPELDYNKEGNFGGISLKIDMKNMLTYKIQQITLDSLSIPKCNLIKIDVEGMETEVLKGSKSLIQKYKPFLYVENNRKEQKEKLLNLIKEYGYKIHNHEPYMFNENNYLKEKENIYKNVISENLLCVHESIDIQVTT